MYNSAGLVPARFLILISHFTICFTLLWNNEESVKSCLPETVTKYHHDNHLTQWVTGLSIMITMLCIEMLAFLIGLTMFNSTSALLSVGGHALSCIFLTGLILNSWQCGWFWWIFAFGTVLPFLYDSVIIIDDLSVQQPGWSKLLILASVSTTLGLTLPVGYNIGVVNTPAQIIRNFCNDSIYSRFDAVLNEAQLDIIWSSIVSIFLVGATVGSLGGSLLADKIGRKGVLVVCSVLAAIAAILFFGSKPANSVEIIFLARLFAGLSAGLTTSVVPMYLTELAPLHLKGATGVLTQLGVTIGVLLGQVISMHGILGNKDFWPHCLAAYALPLFICTAVFLVLPESPKYLFVIKRQPQVALQQLSKLRNVDQSLLQEEINELKLEDQDNRKATGQSWTLGKVISDSTLLLPLLLVCALQAGQQLSGINAVFYYSSDIFRTAGLSTFESEFATIGTGCCNLFMAIISMYVMSRVDRRICIQISLGSSILFLIILGVAVMYMKTNTWVPYISIVGVLGFVTCYGIGLGPIPYFVGSELFEVGPRPSAMSLGSMSNWGANFIIGLTFPTMQSCIGSASFFIFAAITVGLFVFIRWYLPETRGRDPTEIASLCQNGFSSKPLKGIMIRSEEDANNAVI